MLIIGRRNSESIVIRPQDGVDPQLTLADLFEHGPIEIKIFAGCEKRVTIGVEAPRQLTIWRKNPEKA